MARATFLRDFDYREVRVSQAIIQQARQVLLVTDHTKFGRNALVELGHISQVHVLFTDRPPPAELASVLAETTIKVRVAGTDETESY